MREPMSRNDYRADLTPEEIADPDRWEWVHDVGVKGDFLFGRPGRRVGDVLGWRDKRSATGHLSGIIQEIDYASLRVRVNNIRAGIITRPTAERPMRPWSPTPVLEKRENG